MVARADSELAAAVGHGKVTLAKAAEQVGAAKRKPAAKPKNKPPAQETKPVALTPAQQAKAAKDDQHAEAEQLAEDAYGDFDALKELEEARAEIEVLQKVIAAAEADDKKAELIKWRRAYDAAVRGQSAAMDRASSGAVVSPSVTDNKVKPASVIKHPPLQSHLQRAWLRAQPVLQPW